MSELNQPVPVVSPHYGQYPEGDFPILLAYAFRPFFLLLPAYLVLSILLWSAYWAGWLPLPMSNPLAWHIYELLFGLGAAGIAGFLLTALPEFFDDYVPIVGKPLGMLVALWCLGRISVWLHDWLGILGLVILVLSHVAMTVAIAWLVWRPIWQDPLKRHREIIWTLLALLTLQTTYLLAYSGLIAVDLMALLKLAVGLWMILVLQVLRRVSTGVTNEWLEQQQVDDIFLARPPLFNLAVFTVLVFSVVEFFLPYNSILGWLGLAVAAACLNLLNDYWQPDTSIFWRPVLWPLWMIALLLALGYGAMGVDQLMPQWYGLNHLRHILTTGALGLAYLMVLMIVAQVHTGRGLRSSWAYQGAVMCLLLAVAVRVGVAFWPLQAGHLYGVSALLWAAAFSIFLLQYGPYLWQPRKDNLPG